MSDEFSYGCKKSPDTKRVNVSTLPTQVSLSRLHSSEKRRFMATLEQKDPALHALLHSEGFRKLIQTLQGEYIMDQDKYRQIMSDAS